MPHFVPLRLRGHRAKLSIVAATALLLAGAVMPPDPSAAAEPSVPGSFVSMAPTRLLDTRIGTGAPAGAVPANSAVRLQVTDRLGIPQNGVAAVVLNVTAVGPTAPGFLTVYPSGTTQPTASNVNFAADAVVPNLVTVKVGADGGVDIANASNGTVHLLADAAGYYLGGTPTSPGAFVSVEPSRVLDTRVGIGASAAVASYSTVSVQIGGRGGVPSTGVAAVVMNITVTAPWQSGFITAYPTGSNQPWASNLNFEQGATVPNLVTVKVGANGQVDLANWAAGRSHLIADVAGYYLDGTPSEPGTFVSLAPVRLTDTRPPGLNHSPTLGKAGGSGTSQVTGEAGIPASGVGGVVINVTATTRTDPGGFITVFPAGTSQPYASNINYTKPGTIANLVVVKLGANGRIQFAHEGPFRATLIGDVAGYFLSDVG